MRALCAAIFWEALFQRCWVQHDGEVDSPENRSNFFKLQLGQGPWGHQGAFLRYFYYALPVAELATEYERDQE